MSNVGEKRSYFPLRVIDRANSSELRVGLDGFKKRGARVEPLPFAGGTRLIGDAVEKRIGDDVGHGAAVARGGVARPLLAALAAVVVAGYQAAMATLPSSNLEEDASSSYGLEEDVQPSSSSPEEDDVVFFETGRRQRCHRS
nr:uncharacterized protein LOC105950329 [Ipomoea batatas]